MLQAKLEVSFAIQAGLLGEFELLNLVLLLLVQPICVLSLDHWVVVHAFHELETELAVIALAAGVHLEGLKQLDVLEHRNFLHFESLKQLLDSVDLVVVVHIVGVHNLIKQIDVLDYRLPQVLGHGAD